MTSLKRVAGFLGLLLVVGSFTACGKDAVKAPQETTPLYYQTAVELTQAIQEKKVTSLELLNIYIDRIQRYNGPINAVVAMDIQGARARAMEADKALARGEIWGPLHGLPMTVKDIFAAVGMPATSGDPKLKDYMPPQNADAVQRLVDAGAIILGKTNLPFHGLDFQSFNEVYGTTNNPWDLKRTPGGSSGGSAAALAAGFTPLELGSDLGGSIRTPSHFCGTFGHKPTWGLVSLQGHIPPMPPGLPRAMAKRIPLMTAGPMARSAEDLELAFEVLVDPEESHRLLPVRHKKISDYRVAVWLSDPYSYAEIDKDMMEVLLQTAQKLKSAGLAVDLEARPDINFEKIAGGLYYKMTGLLVARKTVFPKELVEEQEKLKAAMAAFFQKYDVLLAPVTATAALAHDHTGDMYHRNITVNGKEKRALNYATWPCIAVAAELPATVAPVGLTPQGLPIGIQIIGARDEDRTTIDFARGLSKIVGGFRIPPGYEG
ncbi:MAG: amidase family protein [Desulfobacteraceae bacterium]|nr:amidase family protein [Desulfobacteraceae bacterium]